MGEFFDDVFGGPRIIIRLGLLQRQLEGFVAQRLTDGLEQFGHAFAMLCRQADRFSQPQRPGFHHALGALFAFGLVGGQDNRDVGLAQQGSEVLVLRRHADAGID